MKVRAVRKGYFGETTREPGDVFECKVSEFSDSMRKANPPGWMEIVDASSEEQKAVDEIRSSEGVRKNKPPTPKGSAADLGVSKAAHIEAPGVETKPEGKPSGKGGGTGSKDVLTK
jgi:hypothetical protein